VPADNPVTPAKVALGRRLFYDVRLSGNGTQACASCHAQSRAFTDGRPRAVGSTGERHPRGTMSLANVAYSVSLTWTGRRRVRLEDQMLVPLFGTHPVEMGLAGRAAEVRERLRADIRYPGLFAAAFPGEREPVTLANVRRTIASFERTLLSGNSAYDRLVWKDDRTALSESARRGMALFFSERLACSTCHAGPTFSGPVEWEGSKAARPKRADNGLGGPYRIPTLRNIAVTGPYMHDGRLATLADVITYYAKSGGDSPRRSPLVMGFALGETGEVDLLAFLRSLTDDGFLTDVRFSNPSPPDGGSSSGPRCLGL
jgi:cytochrome c peroxidase